VAVMVTNMPDRPVTIGELGHLVVEQQSIIAELARSHQALLADHMELGAQHAALCDCLCGAGVLTMDRLQCRSQQRRCMATVVLPGPALALATSLDKEDVFNLSAASTMLSEAFRWPRCDHPNVIDGSLQSSEMARAQAHDGQLRRSRSLHGLGEGADCLRTRMEDHSPFVKHTSHTASDLEGDADCSLVAHPAVDQYRHEMSTPPCGVRSAPTPARVRASGIADTIAKFAGSSRSTREAQAAATTTLSQSIDHPPLHVPLGHRARKPRPPSARQSPSASVCHSGATTSVRSTPRGASASRAANKKTLQTLAREHAVESKSRCRDMHAEHCRGGAGGGQWRLRESPEVCAAPAPVLGLIAPWGALRGAVPITASVSPREGH
jgi:hypothetical protein